MVVTVDIIDELGGYENLLVKQFHIMEKLVDVSLEERKLILHGSPDSMMKNTEEKEAILDKFSLLDENMRMLLQKISLKLGIHSEKTNIQEILPSLDIEDSSRINRLLDGINILVERAMELNLGNQALVMTRMDWLTATQSFIASLMQREECYTMPMMDGMNRNLTVSGLEYRA